MTVSVVGPGVDGELLAANVHELLRLVGGTLAGNIATEDVDAIRSLLSWHPTEATTIAAAAALGARGAVDMRRGIAPVTMDASSAEVWTVLHPEPQAFPIARALLPTTSLAAAEDVVRRVAVNELDYERRQTDRRHAAQPTTLAAFVDASREAGATHATTRRILEGAHADLSDLAPAARVDSLGLWALDRLTATS